MLCQKSNGSIQAGITIFQLIVTIPVMILLHKCSLISAINARP